MVLSIIIALVTTPGLLGTQEAIRQGQGKERREEHRARRCNLVAQCIKASSRSNEINGRQIVLADNKVSEIANMGRRTIGLTACFTQIALR